MDSVKRNSVIMLCVNRCKRLESRQSHPKQTFSVMEQMWTLSTQNVFYKHIRRGSTISTYVDRRNCKNTDETFWNLYARLLTWKFDFRKLHPPSLGESRMLTWQDSPLGVLLLTVGIFCVLSLNSSSPYHSVDGTAFGISPLMHEPMQVVQVGSKMSCMVHHNDAWKLLWIECRRSLIPDHAPLCERYALHRG